MQFLSDGEERLLRLVFLLGLFSIPLGIWKFIELVLYLCRHIHWI